MRSCVVAVILTLALAAPRPSRAENPAKAAQLAFDQGSQALKDGQYEKAVELFKASLAKQPIKQTWLNLGVAYGKLKQADAAIDAYQKALAMDPKYVLALFNLGMAYQGKNDLDQAVVWFRKTIEADPKHALAHLNLGAILLEREAFDDALVQLKQVVELMPDNADALYSLGVVYGKQAAKKTAKADAAARAELAKLELDAYTKAVEKDPQHFRAWYNLGQAHHVLGRLDDEIAAYQKAIAVKADFAIARYALASAYQDKKDAVNALKAWEEYVEVADKLPGEKEYVEAARKAIQQLKKAGGRPKK